MKGGWLQGWLLLVARGPSCRSIYHAFLLPQITEVSENLSSLCQWPGLRKGPFFPHSVGLVRENCQKSRAGRNFYDSYKSRAAWLSSESMPTCCLIKIISGVKRLGEGWSLWLGSLCRYLYGVRIGSEGYFVFSVKSLRFLVCRMNALIC